MHLITSPEQAEPASPPARLWLMERELRWSRNAYWLVILAFLVAPHLMPGPAVEALRWTFYLAHLWLALCIGRAARKLGSTVQATGWAVLSFVLGPLGMLLIPPLFLRRLQRAAQEGVPEVGAAVAAPERTHLERLIDPVAPTDAETQYILDIQAIAIHIVKANLEALGLPRAFGWGARRPFILGYTMGVTQGLGSFIGPTTKWEFAGLNAAAHVAEADVYDEVLTYAQGRGGAAYAGGLEAGRLDGAQCREADHSFRLVKAFKPNWTEPVKAGAPAVTLAAPQQPTGGRSSEIVTQNAVVAGVVALLALAAISLYGYEQSGPRVAERKEDRMGAQASKVGARLADSIRACRSVGIQGVDACAKSTGILDQDVAARDGAVKAVQAREEFLNWCPDPRSTQDCGELLQRAVNIAWNTKNAGK